MRRLVRMNSDKEIRALARDMRSTGSLDSTVRLAQLLLQRGLIPSGVERAYQFSSAPQAAAGHLPSFMVTPSPPLAGSAQWSGEDLCIVPISPHLIFVQIGGHGSGHGSDRGYYEARSSWPVEGERGTEPIPGMPVRTSATAYTPGTRESYQEFRALYTSCQGMRPLVYKKSRKSKAWPASGHAAFRVFPEEGYRVHAIRSRWESAVNISFHGGRSPANYSQVLAQHEALLLGRLQRYVASWAAAHPEASAVAALDIDVTTVARALQTVEAQSEVVAGAVTRLEKLQTELGNLLGQVLPRLGF